MNTEKQTQNATNTMKEHFKEILRKNYGITEGINAEYPFPFEFIISAMQDAYNLSYERNKV